LPWRGTNRPFEMNAASGAQMVREKIVSDLTIEQKQKLQLRMKIIKL
jgi:hypothetical protein